MKPQVLTSTTSASLPSSPARSQPPEEGGPPGAGELDPAVLRRGQRDIQAARMVMNRRSGRSLYFGFGRSARVVNAGAGLRDWRCGVRGEVLISEDAGDHHERESHRGCPVRPTPFLKLDRSDRLEHVGGADRLRSAHGRVIFSDQGLGIDAHGACDASDVAAGIEVAAAAREAATLEPPDNGRSDAGALLALA